MFNLKPSKHSSYLLYISWLQRINIHRFLTILIYFIPVVSSNCLTSLSKILKTWIMQVYHLLHIWWYMNGPNPDVLLLFLWGEISVWRYADRVSNCRLSRIVNFIINFENGDDVCNVWRCRWWNLLQCWNWSSAFIYLKFNSV